MNRYNNWQSHNMTLLKNIYRSLTFRCCLSLAIGLGIVTFIAVELATLAFDGALLKDTATTETAAYVETFPENEEMLRDMAKTMARAHALNSIETASGE